MVVVAVAAVRGPLLAPLSTTVSIPLHQQNPVTSLPRGPSPCPTFLLAHSSLTHKYQQAAAAAAAAANGSQQSAASTSPQSSPVLLCVALTIVVVRAVCAGYVDGVVRGFCEESVGGDEGKGAVQDGAGAEGRGVGTMEEGA